MNDDEVKKVWDAKADSSIRIAYIDAMEWIEVSKECKSNTITTVAERAKERLEKYIKPQMKARGMT